MQRAKAGEKGSLEDERVVSRLRALLGGEESESVGEEGSEGDRNGDSVGENDYGTSDLNGAVTNHHTLSGDGQAIESAESPLQLLAASHRAPGQRITTPKDSSKLGAFFAPAQVSLDIGDDFDPISLGLVSEDEAESLMTL